VRISLLDAGCAEWTKAEAALCWQQASKALYEAAVRTLFKELVIELVRYDDKKLSKLFLKPVTDKKAPGYSAVIQRPMCLQNMSCALRSQARTLVLLYPDPEPDAGVPSVASPKRRLPSLN